MKIFGKALIVACLSAGIISGCASNDTTPAPQPALSTTEAELICGDCSDGDSCTLDTCNLLTGKCIHVGICCSNNSECDDGLLCTVGQCLLGSCVFNPLLGCDSGSGGAGGAGGAGGSSSGGAASGGAASGGAASGGASSGGSTSGGSTSGGSGGTTGGIECGVHDDCRDGVLCTADICLPNGKCANHPVPLCCSGASDCDTGLTCTTGACNNNQCEFTTVDGCVEPGAGGAGGSGGSGGSGFPPDVKNCTTRDDCNDSDPCTEDYCVEPGRVCINVPLGESCNGSGGAGGSSSGGSSSGGTTSGGTSSGGTANGGSSNGGTASGGTTNGGTASGGTTNGGTASGGTANGGSSNGGTSGLNDPEGLNVKGGALSCSVGTNGAAPVGAGWLFLISGLAFLQRRRRNASNKAR